MIGQNDIGGRFAEVLAREGVPESVSEVAVERVEAAFGRMIERGMRDAREWQLISNDKGASKNPLIPMRS